MVSRRAAGPDDDGFLRELDAAVRFGLFSGPGWDERTRAEMLDLQFTARRAHRPADAREEIILLDGQRAGALVARREGDEVHVLDLAVAPGLRGRGVGSAALAGVLGVHAARIEVEAANAPARRFYGRLGFAVENDDGVTVTMRRAARPATD